MSVAGALITAALGVVGLVLLVIGGFLSILTVGGDGSGDTRIHETGCVFAIVGGLALIAALGVRAITL